MYLKPLTMPTSYRYAATEDIKFLLEVVGRDVVTLRRNASVSRMLVKRAREIYDAIDTYINKTLADRGWEWALECQGASLSFAMFPDVNHVIDLTEDALFQLVAYTEDKTPPHLFKGNTIEDCIISVHRGDWVTDRDGVLNALKLLETAKEFTNLFDVARQAEREKAQALDDGTFLGEVIADIEHSFTSIRQFRVPPKVLKMLENFRDLHYKIATRRASSPGYTVLAIQTGLLVQGVTKLAFHTDNLDSKTVNHLRGGDVWATAAQLVELLSSIRDDGSTSKSMEKALKNYDDFLKILNVEGKELRVPSNYLLPLVSAWRVRRPFRSQACALVSLCYTLVTEWKLEKNRTQDNLSLLEAALDATAKGLEEAVVTVKELKIFNLDNLEFHPAYQALEKAQAQIKTCHDKLFEIDDWHECETSITEAIKKDKERMSQLNQILEKRPSPTAQNQMELTVYVHEQTLGNVYQITSSVDEDTRLSVVRWTVAAALEEPTRKQRAHQNGAFVLLPDETPCDLQSTISQFAGSSRRCSLRLNI